MTRTILVELNELNMEYVSWYVSAGRLPTFGRLLARFGLTETTSEANYEEIEPWIQWVTAHTGLELKDHGVFRLGDIRESSHEQIWEHLEARGLSVAAVSPMNAINRTKSAAFFIPDPWTQTEVSGGTVIRELYRALAQAVADNSKQRIEIRSYVAILVGWLANFRASSLPRQFRAMRRRKSQPWSAAIFLDRLLADVFVTQWNRSRPEFSSVFVNAAAHIQHHYMYSSAAYRGPHRNPNWYLPEGTDPLLDVYELYDEFLAELVALPGAPRLVVATGLHQDPQQEPIFYYRLRDHATFLRRLGVTATAIVPLMSRDFRIEAGEASVIARDADLLRSVRAPNGAPLFEVDDRGDSLFVTLVYPGEIKSPFVPTGPHGSLGDIAQDVVFVALKNGQHNGTGYLMDTGGGTAGQRPSSMPLSGLFDYIVNICAARKQGRGEPLPGPVAG